MVILYLWLVCQSLLFLQAHNTPYKL